MNYALGPSSPPIDPKGNQLMEAQATFDSNLEQLELLTTRLEATVDGLLGPANQAVTGASSAVSDTSYFVGIFRAQNNRMNALLLRIDNALSRS